MWRGCMGVPVVVQNFSSTSPCALAVHLLPPLLFLPLIRMSSFFVFVRWVVLVEESNASCRHGPSAAHSEALLVQQAASRVHSTPSYRALT